MKEFISKWWKAILAAFVIVGGVVSVMVIGRRNPEPIYDDDHGKELIADKIEGINDTSIEIEAAQANISIIQEQAKEDLSEIAKEDYSDAKSAVDSFNS